ncbi:hypothetical protein H9P43_002965 [Blastocladiella emersonii ATCC 22665]|nr:hypothetical protein H9P43_002965 [Blastocladiella emersonii ATCC 22665]
MPIRFRYDVGYPFGCIGTTRPAYDAVNVLHGPYHASSPSDQFWPGPAGDTRRRIRAHGARLASATIVVCTTFDTLDVYIKGSASSSGKAEGTPSTQLLNVAGNMNATGSNNYAFMNHGSHQLLARINETMSRERLGHSRSGLNAQAFMTAAAVLGLIGECEAAAVRVLPFRYIISLAVQFTMHLVLFIKDVVRLIEVIVKAMRILAPLIAKVIAFRTSSLPSELGEVHSAAAAANGAKIMVSVLGEEVQQLESPNSSVRKHDLM